VSIAIYEIIPEQISHLVKNKNSRGRCSLNASGFLNFYDFFLLWLILPHFFAFEKIESPLSFSFICWFNNLTVVVGRSRLREAMKLLNQFETRLNGDTYWSLAGVDLKQPWQWAIKMFLLLLFHYYYWSYFFKLCETCNL